MCWTQKATENYVPLHKSMQWCTVDPKVKVLRIQDVYLGSRILIFSIPDPTTTKREREKNKFVVVPFFVDMNFTKFTYKYYIFLTGKEKDSIH